MPAYPPRSTILRRFICSRPSPIWVMAPAHFPESEEASQHVLALPVFPQMTEEQQKMVVDGIARFFSERA